MVGGGNGNRSRLNLQLTNRFDPSGTHRVHTLCTHLPGHLMQFVGSQMAVVVERHSSGRVPEKPRTVLMGAPRRDLATEPEAFDTSC
jgi:hypothetical protein